MISGTNGLLGAADGAFVMQKEKRTDNKAVLEVAGRDQQDQKLWLNFNRERCVWELTKTETELWKEPEDPLLEKIKELVTETTPEWAGTATELVEVLQVEMQPNALSRKLNVSLERLILEYGIQYKTERGHDGRTSVTICDGCDGILYSVTVAKISSLSSRPSRKGETWKENYRYRYQKIYYWHCSSIILPGMRNICRR